MDLQKKLKNFLFSPQNEAGKFYADVTDEAASALLLHCFGGGKKGSMVAAFPDTTRGERFIRDVECLLKLTGYGDCRIMLLPEAGRGKVLFAGSESRRARVLNAALHGEFDIIAGSITSLFGPAPMPDVTRNSIVTLKPGEIISPDELLNKLVAMDYDDEIETVIPGEFARRGGIIDIYSPAYDYPCRIEFFGDEIESLRSFSPVDQRSTGRLDEYRVIGRGGVTAGGAADGDIFSYFEGAAPELVLFYPEECRERLEKYSGAKVLERFEDICEKFSQQDKLNTFCMISGGREKNFDIQSSPVVPLLPDLPVSGASEISDAAGKISRHLVREQISNLAKDGGLLVLSRHAEDIPEIEKWCRENFDKALSLSYAEGELSCGFYIPGCRTGIITRRELDAAGFTHENGAGGTDRIFDLPRMGKTAVSQMQSKEEELHAADLESGDLAVHIDHGIGIFRGFKKLVTNGLSREVMVLEYRDGQLLYVPLLSAHKISRYLGSPGKVSLHRLGGGKWDQDKENARKGVRTYAADMLRMQAVRKTVPGLPVSDNVPNWKSFLRSFAFEDTPDQQKATLEIAEDMTSGTPMDRLLCGDVGYGKTEIAMRAAFLAVSSGYQVAVLAPTTVLAQQHYLSFQERFAGYPVTVEVLNRYRSASDTHRILANLASGGVDIIIGTHRLCSKEVKFRNPGLVIIDEEQRFGVNHKERLRRFRLEADVLAMSATPIPRTLYLAMAGMRDLSTLTTAPKLRTPVRTVISPEDIKVAAGAIRNELARGGQVYYLHNRVKSINDRCSKLKEQLPECRFGVAHAGMAADDLEKVMSEFVSGKIDCLVSTTIIESGLDVPNANTIIIDRADRFGLAELYQLRGRVGRSSRQAYAYMFLPRDQIITSDARKRLAALRRCTSQGSGFQLALRDLEIRGSGNLLGQEQSGHLNLIGFDLYCHLLKMEIARLSGKEVKFSSEVNIGIDFVVFAKSDKSGNILCALFPEEYIPGERLRVESYRRIAQMDTLEEVDDFQAELADRFGKIPEEAKNLLDITRLRIMAANANLRSVNVVDAVVVLQSINGEIYRDSRGKRPVLDYRDPPRLRIEHIKQYIMKASKVFQNAPAC